MNTLPLLRPLLLTLAWTAGDAVAQEPSTSLAPTESAWPFAPQVIPIHTAEPDGGIEYGRWGAGAGYKASFHGDMTFVPFLGEHYPHNQPWSFRTTSVRAGGLELLAADAKPERWHSGVRAEYRHGFVTEAYDLRLEGLEQTFVFERPPAVAGDLVVKGVVTTGLSCTAHQGVGPLEFVDVKGERILDYGSASVVDAAGRQTAIATSWDGRGELLLTVPGDWLAAATYPVTIDPLLFGAIQMTGSDTFHSVDVARDDVLNQFVYVYATAVSASDHDVQGYLASDGYAILGLIYGDITASWDSPQIHVAVAGSPQRYLLVFERLFTGFSHVIAHLHAGGDANTSTILWQIAGVGGVHNWRSDVGGQIPGQTPSGNDKFLVVWQRDLSSINTGSSSVWARTMTTAGTIGTEFPIAIGVTIALDCESPSVNQEARYVSSQTQWLVVYQNFRYAGPPTWTVEGRLVNDQGVLNNNTWQASGNGAASHRLAPQVAGAAGRYLVSFTDTTYAHSPTKVTLTNGMSLKTERVDWAGNGTPVNHAETTLFGPYTNERMVLGSVAYDSRTQSHWGVVSASDRAYGGSGRTIMNRVGYQGSTTESVTLESATSVQQGEPGGCCFDDDSSTFLCSWSMNTNLAGAGHMAVQRLGYTAPLSITQNGTACSTASIAWSGSQQIGSEFNAATLSGAPANSLAILAVAWAPLGVDLTAIGMTGCWLNVVNAGPDFLGTVTASISGAGTASVPLALPEFLDPADLWFQWFVLQPGANALHLVSTPGLRVPIVK